MTTQSTYKYFPGNSGIHYSKFSRDKEPSSMSHESRNFNIGNGECSSRGGTQHWNQYTTHQTVSFFQFIKGPSSFCMSVSSEGTLRANDVILKTGLIFRTKPTFLLWNQNIILFTNGSPPQVWDGVSGSSTDIPSDKMPADWTLNNEYPDKVLVHGSLNSERGWASGVSLNNKVLYFSVTNDGISAYPDFAEIDKAGFIYIETGDDLGITAFVEYGDRLLIFGSEKSFILIDTETDTSKWGYVSTQMTSGCASQNLLVKTENDIVVMMYDGSIYSVSAVQQYGDYKMSSITAPSGMQEYIQKYVNLTEIDKFHCIFDPILRAIKFFAVPAGSQEVSMALVLFIDKGIQNGWMIHDNEEANNGYKAISSALFREGPSSSSISHVITSNSDSFLWELETFEMTDNSYRIPMRIVTPFLSMDDPRNTKRFKRAYLDILYHTKMLCRIQFYNNDYFQKDTDIILRTENSDAWDIGLWDKFTWDVSHRKYEMVRYPINLIGVNLKQVFEFNLDTTEFRTLWDEFIWDIDKWDSNDPNPLDLFSKVGFSISSNMIDYAPVATRTRLNVR